MTLSEPGVRHVTAAVAAVAARDDHLFHIKAFDLPGRERKLVISTDGIVALGKVMAENYLAVRGR